MENKHNVKKRSAKDSLAYVKEHAKSWSESMGIRPRKLPSGKAIWETQFVNEQGHIATRKRTIQGTLNQSNTPFHIPTTGIGVTKVIKKEFKIKTPKPVKQRKSDYREMPQHYKDMVNRSYNERHGIK